MNCERPTTSDERPNSMHSISDERNWLTWLVKVRILILLVLLAIELAKEKKIVCKKEY